MEVLILLVFVSLVLVGGAIGFFAWNVANHAHEHSDRLALLPLDDRAERRAARDATDPNAAARSLSRDALQRAEANQLHDPHRGPPADSGTEATGAHRDRQE